MSEHNNKRSLPQDTQPVSKKCCTEDLRIPTTSNEDTATEHFKLLTEIFPDADPHYLNIQSKLRADNVEEFKNFTATMLDWNRYPRTKDILKEQQLSAQIRQYTTEFSVEEFLKIIPDPHGFFVETKPAVKLNLEERSYIFNIFKNIFRNATIRSIRSALNVNKYNVLKAAITLDANLHYGVGRMTHKRLPIETENALIQNIPLLQVVAYVQHRGEIESFLKRKEQQMIEERLHAKLNNLFLTCGCCFDEEVMPQDVATCEMGCIFCKKCIQKSVEVLFGEAKLHYPCLGCDCISYFSLQTLKEVLTPKLFLKVAQKKQLEEVKAAGIEDLETCPFCDFATIPVQGDKVFHCLNPECMKESCRLCKEPSHIPFRCEEIEKDDDVKNRTYIENKMTEALIRKCYKCGLLFVKSIGCNKMTCSCGAHMCYICGKPVTDYKHFKDDEYDKRSKKCPLFSDTITLHKEAVLKSAKLAKAEIGVGDKSTLKIDPTIDVENYYKKLQMKEESFY